MRIDLPQEARLRAAAEANGETLTSFVLAAAVDRAERVLRRSSRISLNAARFARFVAGLEGPVEPMPNLKRHAERPSPIPPR